MLGEIVTAHVVKARWAYSEIPSPRFGKKYEGVGPDHIHQAARSGVSFDKLTTADHDALVDMLYIGRPGSFGDNVDRAPTYRCEALTKNQVMQLWALPAYNPPLKQTAIPYREFYFGVSNTGPGGAPEDSDARVMARKIPDEPFNPDHEPVIVIKVQGHDLLLEGYLRSILFMRSPQQADLLRAWCPIIAASVQPRPSVVSDLVPVPSQDRPPSVVGPALSVC